MGAAVVSRLEASPSATTSLVDSVLTKHGTASPKNNSTMGLFYRKTQVFYTAAVMFADYKLLQWRCDQIDDTPEGEELKEKLWDAAHERNSVFLANKCISLAALWVKFGQYVSSRADVMPEPYLRALAKCQDALPPRPYKDLIGQIEAELKQNINTVFSSIETDPIAVASIASVHRAVLLDGRQVVVKVQHANVRDQLLQDLRCLETIGDTVRYLDPDFDMSPVIREWAKEVPRELDFLNEARNMQRVEANLARSKAFAFKVSIAQVIPELVTEKLLVMSFIDGFKVDNRALLEEFKVDRRDAMRHITESYAHQIFVDGFFSGDPHPGNILIDKASGLPVLLDFGLTKEVPPNIRESFAKLIVAADEADIHGVLTALEGVGLRLRTDVPFDTSLLVKYFFRDANTREVAQQEGRERRAEWKKVEEIKKKRFYQGDKVDVSFRNAVGWRHSSKGEIVKQVPGEDAATVRFTDGHEKTVQWSQLKLQKSRSPIDAWPDAFIFFERVLGLLRGLTASLEVSQSYLEVMTPFARHAILKDKDAPLPAGLVSGTDELQVKQLIAELLQSGDLLGCQVAVIKDDQLLVDVCGGVLDPYERRPVTPDAVFNCFSVTKAISAACVHLLLERGLIHLDDPICKHWPAFAANGKEGITVLHVLNHQAGLANAGTEDMTTDPYLVTDSFYMLKAMESAVPESPPGAVTQYHYLSFGWILDGLVRKVTGQGMQEFAAKNIAEPLHVSSELMIGVDPSLKPSIATLVLQRTALEPPTSAERIKKLEAEAESSSKRPTQAPNMLMNPTFFNNPRIQEASLPAANGHFSARSLAQFYASLLPAAKSPLFQSNEGILPLLYPAQLQRDDAKAPGQVSNEKMLQGEQGSFRLGYVLFPSSAPAEDPRHTPFGHGGLGGSIAFCDPANRIAVAITLNRLNFNSVGSRSIIRQVYSGLQLPVPSAFSK